MDEPWWRKYFHEARQACSGDFASTCTKYRQLGVMPLVHEDRLFRGFENSGAGAIAVAIHAKAARILLLGYDCQRTGGQVHWHGNHPTGLGNGGSMLDWPGQFARLKKAFPHQEIINCSRHTALQTFPRAELSACLDPSPVLQVAA